MPKRLRGEEVVTIEVLAAKGQDNCEIARTMEVTEGTVRYHLRRAAAGAEDGRAKRRYKAEYASVLRYARARHPRPKLRTYRRVETPPGAQSQTDWGEFRGSTSGRVLSRCTRSRSCCH